MDNSEIKNVIKELISKGLETGLIRDLLIEEYHFKSGPANKLIRRVRKLNSIYNKGDLPKLSREDIKYPEYDKGDL